MMRAIASRARRVLTVALTATFFSLAVLLAVSGCHDKNPLTPNDTSYRLVLRNADVFYRNHVGGHVENDTITVRLYNANNGLVDSVRLRCQCQFSRDSVSAALPGALILTKADTVRYPAGCFPALIYWGSGPQDPQAREVVECWAVRGQDSIAHDTTSFFVHDPDTAR